jgi:sugar lactone lactonase YvrE
MIFITNIYFIIATSNIPNIAVSSKWTQNAVTMAGGHGGGSGLDQLYHPFSLYVDEDQTIYVAEHFNHRITEWKSGATSGRVVAGGNEPGNRNDQLHCPIGVMVDKKNNSLIISEHGNGRIVRWPHRNGTSGEIIVSNISCWGLAMDNDGDLYISDYNKHEVRRWKMEETNGTVVAGGNGAGNRRDQLNHPTFLFVDENHSVYVSDVSNHRVMKWIKGAKEGIVVAGGQGAGNSLTQLSSPYGVVVDQVGTVYVADYGNQRVMRWSKGATQGSVVVGGNGGGGANQFSNPVDLRFDRQGNLYVGDQSNHRIQKFNIEPSSNS